MFWLEFDKSVILDLNLIQERDEGNGSVSKGIRVGKLKNPDMCLLNIRGRILEL